MKLCRFHSARSSKTTLPVKGTIGSQSRIIPNHSRSTITTCFELDFETVLTGVRLDVT